MAPGGKLIAKHLLGFRDVEKDKRLNRQAARFDPHPHHQVETFRPWTPPAFAPSPARFCIDPRHEILYDRGRVATTQQLQAAGINFPVNAFRRQRPAGGWAWVKLNRPDGQALIPSDAPPVPELDYLDFLGHRLSRRCQHEVGKFCRHCCHGPPRAIRRPKDDEWEHIPWFDRPLHLRDAHGRRHSHIRHRGDGPLYPHPDDWTLDNYPRHPHPRRQVHPRPTLDSESAYNDTDISAWLAARAIAHPGHHDADHLFLGPPRVHRRDLLNTTSSTEDEDLPYVYGPDEEELAAELDDDWYSDWDYSDHTW